MLRQVPPSVPRFSTHSVRLPSWPSADGGVVAAGAAADDDGVVEVGHLFPSSRGSRERSGCVDQSELDAQPLPREGEFAATQIRTRSGASRHSFTRTRNVTASLPSTRRWS